MPSDIIIFRNVSKEYPGEPRPALTNVSFSIKKGEFICLVGASGCGKTTTLKIIAGLEHQSGGQVVKPANVSMAFQQGALFPWLTVYENAALGLRTRGATQSVIERRVETELRAMNMHAFAQKYPADLSGGQRQRVGIARALAIDPEVLLLDEPFSALDPKTTAELHDDLISIWHQTGKTIVMVSHLIEEAVSLGGRVILMREGKVDEIFPVDLPYPRRESDGFHRDVMRIRRAFFS